jgi:NADH-quinone oxidoreductase subunit C/D
VPTPMEVRTDILDELEARFPGATAVRETTLDGIPTVRIPEAQLGPVLRYLREEASRPFAMLYDLFAVDERGRLRGSPVPPRDFTLVYHLLSLERNEDVRLKVCLEGEFPRVPTVTNLWPSADWYEREVWDMFGIGFDGHPRLRRLLMPNWWEGHPLRKEHPARGTEMGEAQMPPLADPVWEESEVFRPEEWGLPARGEDFDYMFLNFGPHHPGTHGVLRIVLQLDGQEVVGAIPDIGYHHRGVEKMGERQSWHTFIPYTDRVDYLAGVLNNLPYCLAVEALAGIEVPERAVVIRVMLAELFRIISHLVFIGTLAQDVGAMSPVFYAFTAREHAFDIVEAITGARMHPAWFRIGGVREDLPEGWEALVRDFAAPLPRVLAEYEEAVVRNAIFRARTVGIGEVGVPEAIAWGATGPMLRACGLDWDFRKRRPYGGYDHFEFDIPTGTRGDCYDRAVVHIEEMRQSLRIIEQCVRNMPAGPVKANHRLATPPLKERVMEDIETLIHHFLSVSWGPVIPPGEATGRIEGAKGGYSYHLVSDGNTAPYRVRIRTPSFAHMQMLPTLARGHMVPDVVAILGTVDYVLADIDR